MKPRLILKYIAFISLIGFIHVLSTKDLSSDRSKYIGKKIISITFEGNRNTESSDILELIESKVGSTLTEKNLNSDIKTLFATGFFFYIDVQAELEDDGVKLIIVLKERPRVAEIEFVGADEVFPSDLREKIPLKENEVITPSKISTSKELILKKYQDEGFFLAYVKVELSEIDEKTNTVVVKFIIDEGEEIPVSKINIFGNREVDTYEILNILELKEAGFLESGTFKEASFETDKQKIVGLLKSKGYIDAELSSDGTNWEIRWENSDKKDKRVIVVNYKILEGDRYYFNGYGLSHDKTVGPDSAPLYLNKENNPIGTPESEFKPVFPPNFFLDNFEFINSDVGEVFDETKFFRDRGFINESYSTRGYLFAQVVPRRRFIELTDASLKEFENCDSKPKNKKDECLQESKELNIERLRKIYDTQPELRGKKFVHIDFEIRENNLAYVENIIIKGNKKTQDRVIRRELLFKSGDLFNSALVNRSRERIFNLGYFKEVNFNMRPGTDETKMNLIIEVVEQPTGTVSMGGGYGTITGFSIFTQLGENNLNGTGQQVSGRLEFGPVRRFFQLSWTEPWIYDKPWSLTLSMFYSSRTLNVGAASITDNNNQAIKERATYDRTGVGVSVGLGHRFLINWTHFHRYSPSFFTSTKPSSLVSDQVLAEVNLGWQFRSQLTNGISYDNRDNIFNTTQGLMAMMSVDNVGQYMGGQSHFDQFSPLLEYYHTWFDYTLFGLFRSNQLRRWRVVQQFRSSSVFTYERAPKYRKQDKEKVPYVQVQDRLFLGGYESLRGWFFDDKYYPDEWKDGSSHRMLFTSELRFPIEPSLLWLVVFWDAGSMFEEVHRAVGERKEYFDAYAQRVYEARTSNPVETYLLENYDSLSGKKYPISRLDINNPERLVLSSNNLALDNFRYSWGFGLRIQIPVLPLRLYFAQKLRFTGVSQRPFSTYEDDKAFQFVFGIGDMRF